MKAVDAKSNNPKYKINDILRISNIKIILKNVTLQMVRKSFYD